MRASPKLWSIVSWEYGLGDAHICELIIFTIMMKQSLHSMQAKYTCIGDDKNLMFGDSVRVYQANGVWSGEVPVYYYDAFMMQKQFFIKNLM